MDTANYKNIPYFTVTNSRVNSYNFGSCSNVDGKRGQLHTISGDIRLSMMSCNRAQPDSFSFCLVVCGLAPVT